MEEKFFVYILQSQLDHSFYKGFTTNPQKRLADHNDGSSLYTANKRPWIIVYLEELPSKKEALIKEKMLKRQNTNYILWLIQQPHNLIK